jgi:hypothetical protein
VKLERKHAWVLIAIAVWTVVIWVRFIFALANDDSGRPVAFFVAHGILIVINFLIATLLAAWGYRVLKASRQA